MGIKRVSAIILSLLLTVSLYSCGNTTGNEITSTNVTTTTAVSEVTSSESEALVDSEVSTKSDSSSSSDNSESGESSEGDKSSESSKGSKSSESSTTESTASNISEIETDLGETTNISAILDAGAVETYDPLADIKFSIISGESNEKLIMTISTSLKDFTIYGKRQSDRELSKINYIVDGDEYKAELELSTPDLATFTILGKTDDGLKYNQYDITKSDLTDYGYIYSSFTQSVHAYNNLKDNEKNKGKSDAPKASIVYIAGYNKYINGDLFSLIESTTVTSSNSDLIDNGEIYSELNYSRIKSQDIDENTVSWYKITDDGEMELLETTRDILDDPEGTSFIVRANTDGVGTYVLLCKKLKP